MLFRSLVRSFRALLVNHFSGLGVDIERHLDFTVTLFRGCFYAIAPEATPIDWMHVDEQALNQLQAAGMCYVRGSLSELHEFLDAYFVPVLLEEGYRTFNIVRYRRRYYGLAQALGHVSLPDLCEADFEDLDAAGQIVIANSLDEAKALIDHRALSSVPEP